MRAQVLVLWIASIVCNFSTLANASVVTDSYSEGVSEHHYSEMTKKELSKVLRQKLKSLENIEDGMPTKLHEITRHEVLMLLKRSTLLSLNEQFDERSFLGINDVSNFALNIMEATLNEPPKNVNLRKESLIMLIALIQYGVNYLENFGHLYIDSSELNSALKGFREAKRTYQGHLDAFEAGCPASHSSIELL